MHEQKEHSHHNHHAHMIKNFKKKFWVSLIVSIPILVLSPLLQNLFNYTLSFPGSTILIFALASFVTTYLLL